MELKTARGRLFFILLLLIALPLLQFNFRFIDCRPLNGSYLFSEDVNFSISGWWDGSYQKEKNYFVNDSMGFRPDLVRFNNQIDYWLFKKLHAGDVEVGIDNYLFGQGYLNEYYGLGSVMVSDARRQLIKLKKIQDTLERLGKTLIFSYTPSKPYFYPDKIPAILRETGPLNPSDYRTFKRLADSLGINQVDFNAMFMAMKDTAKNVLIAKEGIHWTYYGSILAADSMIKYIERKRNIRMPEIGFKSIKYSDSARAPDNDLGLVANTYFPIAKEKLSYPDIVFKSDEKTVRPKVIYIGDSFVWLWLNNKIPQETNNGWEFWSYFEEVWSDDVTSGRTPIPHIATYDWKQAVGKADCIVLMLAPINLAHLLRDDFMVNVFYNYYFPAKKTDTTSADTKAAGI